MRDDTSTDEKQQIKQHYREQTGEELPDHVVENIEYLQASRYNAERLERLRDLESKSRHDKSGAGVALSIAILSLAALGGILISMLVPGTVYTKTAIAFFAALLIATLPRLIVDDTEFGALVVACALVTTIVAGAFVLGLLNATGHLQTAARWAPFAAFALVIAAGIRLLTDGEVTE